MELKTIIVKDVPFTYENEIEDICYENISAISEEDARALIKQTKKLFEAIDLSFYLAFGTLLGAIRDKGLIPGDEDVDVFVEDEQKLYDNLPFLYENGFKLCRFVCGSIYSFRINDRSYIDVYILRPFKWYTLWRFKCFCLSDYATPKKYFKEYEDINFLGETCKCPKQPEQILEFWYGKSWRTPVRGHKFYYEIITAHIWHVFKDDYLKPFIKFIIGYKYWKKKIKKNN